MTGWQVITLWETGDRKPASQDYGEDEAAARRMFAAYRNALGVDAITLLYAGDVAEWGNRYPPVPAGVAGPVLP